MVLNANAAGDRVFLGESDGNDQLWAITDHGSYATLQLSGTNQARVFLGANAAGDRANLWTSAGSNERWIITDQGSHSTIQIARSPPQDSPPPPSGAWHVDPTGGQSCDAVCTAVGKVCSTAGFAANNSDVDTSDDLRDLLTLLLGANPCTSYDTQWGNHATVPLTCSCHGSAV